MATTATTRSRLFPARSRKSYRLEMEGRTLYLLLALMALTGVVIFYLGLVTGMGMRDPNAPAPVAQQGAATDGGDQQEEALPQENTLSFNRALQDEQPLIEGLTVEQEQAEQQTQALISRAKDEMEMEEVAAKGPAAPDEPAKPEVEQAAASQPQPAEEPSAPAAEGEVYTVQVFSSQQQDKAHSLVNKLQGMGFSAYMNRYQAPDNEVWFRVRVGRISRPEAESLKGELQSEANLQATQIIKL